jgi:hypothetical protein
MKEKRPLRESAKVAKVLTPEFDFLGELGVFARDAFKSFDFF